MIKIGIELKVLIYAKFKFEMSFCECVGPTFPTI